MAFRQPPKFSRTRVLFSGAVVLWLLATSLAPAAETWVRIDRPDAATRALAGATAIEYEHFLWAPAETLSVRAGLRGQRLIERPFDMTIDHDRFDPAEGFPELPRQWLDTEPTDDEDFHLVQFQGPIKSEWLEEIRASGIEPIQYIAPFGYIVWGSPTQVQAGRSHRRVRFAGDLPPVMRVPMQSRNSSDPGTDTMAMMYRPESGRIVTRIEQAGFRVDAVTAADRHFSIARLAAGPDDYLELARIPGVLAVQQIAPDGGLRGEMSNQSVVGDHDGLGEIMPGYSDWLADAGLDGDDIIIGVVDSGIRDSHLDLSGRMVPCESAGESPTSCYEEGSSYHGTHVAAAIAGTGASGTTDDGGFLRGLGVAPGARLVEQRFEDFLDESDDRMAPDGMLTIFHESSLSGAIITNNSWGPSGTPQGYDIPTRQVDIITRDADPDTPGQQPVLPVWAIMNGWGDSSGDCAPSSLGSPDEAKNLIGVGSTALQDGSGEQVADIFDISHNSGHGPACDGRRVPHLVAPGCRTDSATAESDSSHGLRCGTSMAAPVVAGAIAVFFEQYQRRFGHHPSPALAKAIFAGTARDLAGRTDADGENLDHRPDRKQGWGRVDLDAVINPSANLSMIDQTVTFSASGQAWSGVYAVHRIDQPVQIMLAWTDAPGPGSGGTTPAWVNDLDLIVEVNGEEYLGNNISPTDGYSLSGGQPDERNNLEGVVLSPNQHLGSDITVTVMAANLGGDALDPRNPGSPRQDFALAAYNLAAPGTALALSFSSQPADTQADEILSEVTVDVVDGFGNLADGPEEYQVEISLEAPDGNPGLDGQTTVETEARQASFSDLSISEPGTYWLRASTDSAGIAEGVSDSFTISTPPALFHDRFEQVDSE